MQNRYSEAPPKRKYLKNIANLWSFLQRYPVMRLNQFFLWMFLLGSVSAKAQDLRFTQWHASEAFVNPAFAGAYNTSRVMLNFRDQWPDMPQTFLSYRAAFDGYFDAIRSGVGAYLWQDNQGNDALEATHLGVQYMYQARILNDWALNLGMQVDYAQFRLNWNQLQFFDQIDLLYGFNDAVGNPNPTTEPTPTLLTDSYVDVGL